MNSLAIEGNSEIDATSSDSKSQETPIHANGLPADGFGPSTGVQNDAYSDHSETPTVWMWVLTFVAGISGVGRSKS